MEFTDAVLKLQDQVEALEKAKKEQDKEMATLKRELANVKTSKPIASHPVDTAALTQRIMAEVNRELSPLRSDVSLLKRASVQIPLIEPKPTKQGSGVPIYLIVIGLFLCVGLAIWGYKSSNFSKIKPVASPITKPVIQPAAKIPTAKSTVQKRRSPKKETDEEKLDRVTKRNRKLIKELGLDSLDN